MTNDLKHIDDLYREKLKNFAPAEKKNRLWYLLSLKLLLLNLSASAFVAIGIGTVVVGTTATLLIVESVNTSENVETLTEMLSERTQTAVAGEMYFQNLSRVLVENSLPVKLYERHTFITSPMLSNDFEDAESSAEFDNKPSDPLAGPQANFSSGIQFLPMESSESYFSMNALSHTGLKERDLKPAQSHEKSQFLDSLLKNVFSERKLSLEIFMNPAILLNQSNQSRQYFPGQDLQFERQQPTVSVSAGFDLKYHWKNWYFATGFNFQSIKQRGSYQIAHQRLDPKFYVASIDTVIRWIFDPPNVGNPVIVRIDTLFIPGYVTDHYAGGWQMTNSLLGIPFRIGHQFHTKPFELEISAGIKMLLPVQQKGGIPVITENEAFRRTGFNVKEVTFNYILEAGLSYPVNEHLRITLKPNYRYNFTNFYADDRWPFGQYYGWFGLKAGINLEL